MAILNGRLFKRLQSRNVLDGSVKVLGSGAVINRAKVRADKITTRVKDRKPNIVPTVQEALGKWQVGSRVTEMIPASIGNKIKSRVSGMQEKGTNKQSGADISL